MLLLPRLNLYRNISPTNKKNAIIMSVNVGSNLDGDKLGMAHLLEHMLLCFDRFRSNGNLDNYTIIGKTYFDTTIYTFISDDIVDNIEKGLSILSKIKNGDFLCDKKFAVIKEDVLNEILYTRNKKLEKELFELLFKNEKCKMNPPVGDYSCVDKIKFKDLCEFFENTYRKSDYRLALLSDLNEEYIKSEFSFFFSEENIDSSKDIFVGLNEKKVYVWDFYKGLGIYIKLSSDSFFNKTINKRVVEDMSGMVIEELLPEYIKYETVVHCQKLRYSLSQQFLSIEIFIKDKNEKDKLLRCNKKEWFSGFIDFLHANMKMEQVDFWKKEYKKYLYSSVTSFDEQIRDITNGIMFGDIVFNQVSYIKALELIEMDDLQQKIREWLDFEYAKKKS